MADRELHVAELPPHASRAFGGVVVDESRGVLLREPKGHFGDYVWTFAKGKANPSETPEEAALREVREETGIEARIVAEIPGWFVGTTGGTKFYVMHVVKDHGDFREETTRVTWANWSAATQLIKQTATATGRARDLLVLKAAHEAVQGSRESV